MYLGVWLIAFAVFCAYAVLWHAMRVMLKGLPTYLNLPFIGTAYRFIGGERMYVSLALIAGAVLCAHAFLWLRGRRARAMLKDLPTFTNLPFIGAFYKFIGGGEAILERVTEMSKISDETNLPFLVWAGPLPVLMFVNVDDIKAVTNAFIEKPYYYSFGRVWVGDGLLTAPGSIWKRSIKSLSGTFNTSIVDGYQEVYNAQAQILVNKLKGEVGREPFHMLEKYLAYTTLETICQTALGVPRISDSIVTAEYYQAFNRAANLLMRRGFNLLMHLDPIYRLTGASKEMKETIAVLHNVSETVMYRIIKERNEKKNTEGGSASTRFKSFLDILLELSERDSFFTPQQIKAEVDTIIVGGQETVATTLFFIMLMMGSKPDVQEKMYAEVKEIFGNSRRPVQKEDLVQMVYCEAVVHETLRLYPPVPTVMRYADKDLKLGSFTVPKSAACGINVWGAGRSRRTWGPDAALFRPERWLQPGFSRTHSSLLLAFSTGRRACIGKKYAMILIKTVLAYCVRDLHFSSEADNLRLAVDLVLRSVGGHLMTVQLR